MLFYSEEQEREYYDELASDGRPEIVYVSCPNPAHKGYPTNGTFDGLCSECEYEMDMAHYEDQT